MRPKTLVVDANVARSAGENTDCAKACRDTLFAIQGHGHKVALCQQLSNEWKQHAGKFAYRWLTAMRIKRRVEQWDLQAETAALKASFPGTIQQRRGIEDVHLLAIAFRASKAVLANDDVARKLFAAHAPKDIRDSIRWSNPCRKERTLEWIGSGLIGRSDLLLSRYS